MLFIFPALSGTFWASLERRLNAVDVLVTQPWQPQDASQVRSVTAMVPCPRAFPAKSATRHEDLSQVTHYDIYLATGPLKLNMYFIAGLPTSPYANSCPNGFRAGGLDPHTSILCYWALSLWPVTFERAVSICWYIITH